MCGRFTLSTPVAEIQRLFGVSESPNLPARWNIAPTQDIAIVRRAEPEGRRELAIARWGLVPHWADDPAIGNRMINIRSETAPDKPAARTAFRRRRCLIPADGFYEWQKRGKGPKQPYLIVRRDRRPFALAGLWEFWPGPKAGRGRDRDASGRGLVTATILTTAANEAVAPLHDRMPVILDEGEWDDWLGPGTSPERLTALMRPHAGDRLEAYPVSTAVNSPVNEGPDLAAPIDGRGDDRGEDRLL